MNVFVAIILGFAAYVFSCVIVYVLVAKPMGWKDPFEYGDPKAPRLRRGIQAILLICMFLMVGAFCYLWIERVSRLPLAQQQGRLAAAVIEANRFAGP